MKQDRDDIKVKANIQKCIFFLRYSFFVLKGCRDRRGFVYLSSTFTLVSILFGMPSLYPFPFLMIFKSCII